MTLCLRAAALPALVALSLVSNPAAAKNPKELVGAWSLESNYSTENGKKTATFGENPMGRLTFTNDGRYSLMITRNDLPAFAGNNRLKGTDKEKLAVNDGLIAHFGSYSVDKDTLVLKIESSSFPNWKGQEQKRTFTLKGKELRWSNPAASGGGVAELVWKKL